MSDTCKDCRDSILNNQDTTIPSPICQGDCPEDVSCEGIGTYSDCVEVNVALDCINTEVGDNLSTVLQAVDEKLCQSTRNTRTVKVSSNDCGCGYLENKLSQGTGITITKVTQSPSGCQTLQISQNPGTLVWNNFTLSSSLTTIPNVQIPQYSNPDALGRVYFRGSFTFSGTFNPGNIINFSSSLPVGSRPLAIRFCTGGYYRYAFNNTTMLVSPTLVYFYTNGGIAVKNITTSPVDNTSLVVLDGFFIDTN